MSENGSVKVETTESGEKNSPVKEENTPSDVKTESSKDSTNGSEQNKVETEAEEKTSDAQKSAIAQDVSPLDAKIIKQIEFYFGDINLAKDKFLLAEIKLDDGWIPLTTMLKFKRLSQLSTDNDVIIGALKKSTSGLMEVSEDGLKIRRSPSKPLPEITKDRVVDNRKRTVYAKNFPVDTSLDALMEYFEQFGAVELVKMRRDFERNFKGSVFTTFSTVEVVDKFLAEPRSFKVEEHSSVDLLIEKLEAYFKRKEAEKKNHTDEKKKEKDAAKQKKEEALEEVNEKTFLEGITHGALLELTGLKDKTRREDIAAVLDGSGENIAWQDYSSGKPKAVIRFNKENGAKEIWEKLVAEATEKDCKVCVLEQEVTGRILEGDEEIEYWRGIRKSQDEKRRANKRKGHGGRGRGRGGPPHKRRR